MKPITVKLVAAAMTSIAVVALITGCTTTAGGKQAGDKATISKTAGNPYPQAMVLMEQGKEAFIAGDYTTAGNKYREAHKVLLGMKDLVPGSEFYWQMKVNFCRQSIEHAYYKLGGRWPMPGDIYCTP
jgi:hypothetical protein